MDSLVEQVSADLKEAMKARDVARKTVLKSLKAALDKERIDKGQELDEVGMTAVIKRQHKQRLESATLYKQHGDDSRAGVESAEAEVIATYLPEQLDDEEIAKHVNAVIEETQASTPADTGKVMGKLSSVLAGQADMKQVAAIVRSRLNA